MCNNCGTSQADMMTVHWEILKRFEQICDFSICAWQACYWSICAFAYAKWTKFLWLTCHQFWNIFPHCNNRVCVESFARQVVNQKPCLIWDILNENFFHEAVHVDKSPEPFNALSKKGQLITVCLRATCKDRSIGWVWKIWARRSAVLLI